MVEISSIDHRGEWYPFPPAEEITPGLAAAIMPTHQRKPELMAEAIWGFLQQDYKDKELIIVHDGPWKLSLDQDYPNVRILNMPGKCTILGLKYTLGFLATSAEYLFLWDDDDYNLSYHMSNHVRYMEENKHLAFCCPYKCYFNLYTKNTLRLGAKHPLSMGCIRHEVLYTLGCPAHSGSDYDAVMWGSMIQAGLKCDITDKLDPIHVYRWDSGTEHASGYGPLRIEDGKIIDWPTRYRETSIEPATITPHCNIDYESWCEWHLGKFGLHSDYMSNLNEYLAAQAA